MFHGFFILFPALITLQSDLKLLPILEFQERNCDPDTWRRAVFRWQRASLSEFLREAKIHNFHMYCIWSWADFEFCLLQQRTDSSLSSLINNGAESNACLLVTNSTNGCGERLSGCGLSSLCYCLQRFLSCLRGSCFRRRGQLQVQMNVWVFLSLGWGRGGGGGGRFWSFLSGKDSLWGKSIFNKRIPLWGNQSHQPHDFLVDRRWEKGD